MNERHFAKLVNKSPYYFWKMKDKVSDELIRDEHGNIWCSVSFYVNPDNVRKWEQAQYKLIKELQVQNKLMELENDFK